MSKYNFSQSGNQLIVSLDTNGDNFEPRAMSYMSPSQDFANGKIRMLESGVYKQAFNFTDFGEIDGNEPTDIENASELLADLIANFNQGGDTPNTYIPLAGTDDGFPVTGKIVSDIGLPDLTNVNFTTSEILPISAKIVTTDDGYGEFRVVNNSDGRKTGISDRSMGCVEGITGKSRGFQFRDDNLNVVTLTSNGGTGTEADALGLIGLEDYSLNNDGSNRKIYPQTGWVQDEINRLIGYTELTILPLQSGTDAPTNTILKNTTGKSLDSLSRIGIGDYELIMASETFTEGKSFPNSLMGLKKTRIILYDVSGMLAGSIVSQMSTETKYSITTYGGDGDLADDILDGGTPITILNYL